MQQELIDKLRGLTAQDLRLWTDSRYIARGRSYLSRVGEPRWSDGVLFWFVAVPGVKAVSGLRDLTRISCQSQREGNEQIAEICERMYESGLLARGRREPYGGVARNT